MTDLENRLLSHAAKLRARAGSSPDIDSALDQAMASYLAPVTAAKVSTRRARFRTGYAVAASIIGVAAVAMLVATHSSGNRQPPTGDGTRATTVPVIVGATVELQDSHALAVSVKVQGSAVPCAVRDAKVQVVSDTTRAVSITVTGFTLTKDTGSGGEGDPSCEIGRYETLQLRLPAAFGTRKLVDATNRKILPTIKGDSAPTARYLPRGWVPEPIIQSGTTTVLSGGRTIYQPPDYSPSYNVDAGSLVPPIAARTYIRNHADPSTIQVITGHLRAQVPGAVLIDRTSVNGAPATIVDSPHSRQRCLTWSPTPQHPTQVCTTVPFTLNGPNLPPQLSTAELLKIARNLKQ